MAIRRTNGTKVSRKQMKKVIMSANNWNEEQYRKKYDIFKNKLRAYENFRKAHGAKVKVQSPQEILYKQAKAMKRLKGDYRPSEEMKRIQSFSAVSITKGKKLAQQMESVYTKRRGALFKGTTLFQFEDFIKKVGKAQELVYGVPLTENSDENLILKLTGGKEYEVRDDGQIYVNNEPLWEFEPITDPVKLEEALKDLADHIHAKQKPSGEIESGETFGSDPLGDDYDISKWEE